MTLPERTSLAISWFSAPSANDLHTGHTRSPNSVTVTLALGEPSVLPCWGIPCSSELTVACAFLAAGLVGLTTDAELEPPLETAIATATSAIAPTTTPPTMRSRRVRRSRSWRARSSASRRSLAASFCALREAMR